ncbi:MAG: hypothetical protein IJR07_00220 [Bacteroidaceae bacterium]|nr:hypothetical protein [Bacteroidaceae bacterium]
MLRVELDDEVKKVSITGKNGEEKVVMRQELDEDELELATGGRGTGTCNTKTLIIDHSCDFKTR